jgi:hypothetical protein
MEKAGSLYQRFTAFCYRGCSFVIAQNFIGFFLSVIAVVSGKLDASMGLFPSS